MSDTTINLRSEALQNGDVEHGAVERKRILLVEGDGFTRLVLLLRLRLAGFGVEFTSNGILGLGKLRTCHPDVLLVELKLNGMSGLDLIKAARAEPAFGDRPIYVFTQADRMSRATRKEVGLLATEVFDKSSVTREDLVQIFSSTFSKREPVEQKPAPVAAPISPPVSGLSEVAVSGALEQLIEGVREQSELLVAETGTRIASGSELLSRVSSLTSCAQAAGLPNLARQAKALQDFLTQLCRNPQGYTDAALTTITRAVEVMRRIFAEPAGKQRTMQRFSAVYLDEAPYSNRAMEEALLNAGFNPACFEDAARAREYLASHRTDLILANVALPEAHGIALSDIRRLSLHSATPVLFGPESTVISLSTDELPISAPRLDKSSILLSEFVVRALNEVQSPALTQAEPSAATAQTQETPATEDGFELFAQTARKVEPSALPLPAQHISGTALKNRQAPRWTAETRPNDESGADEQNTPPGEPNSMAQSFDQAFNSAGIPSEPILRAEPENSDPDCQAQSPEILPVTPTDEKQIDERPQEELAPVDVQLEPAEPPKPESVDEHQADAIVWTAAAVGDDGQIVPALESGGQTENYQTEQQPAVSNSTNAEVMNYELQAVPADRTDPTPSTSSGEATEGQKNPRQSLADRVCAAEMALYHAQAQLEKKSQEIEALQNQLSAAGSGKEVPDQKTQARCLELEGEVAALRQAFEGLNSGFAEAQQPPAQPGPQAQELCSQLEAQKAAVEQSDAARQQAEARCSQLEQELNLARKASEDLAKKQTQEHQDTADSSASPAELEQQVRQGVAALSRATADLAKERGERQRAQQLAAELNGRLKTLHDDLSRTLQVQGDNLSRINALEHQERQTSEALERCTADLEQQQSEREAAEAQLQKTKDANAQLRKDLAFFDDTHKKSDTARQELQTRLEAKLVASREHETRIQQETTERQRLAESLEETRRQLQDQSRRRENLEQELQSAQAALQERESELQKKSAERQRLNETLGSAPRGADEHPERDLEFSKLQSALQAEQVERKRQDTQLARMRQRALDAALAARALRTSLRRQIREPVDNLVHSMRTLLESEIGDEHKKLAEAALQDGLLVQTRLRDPGLAHGNPSEPAAPAAPSAS